VPRTFFSKLKKIKEKGPQIFGFPFVIKGTTGKQGHAVWSPRNEKELTELVDQLAKLERGGKRFIAQEFIKASQRNRVLVVGDKAIAAITRPTRWRRRFTQKERARSALMPIPPEDAELAVKAAKSLDIEIGGVDIIHEDDSHQPYVLEVNSAPRWEAIRADTGVNPEHEIVKFLAGL
jgi:glutathione synthase/RimK-type ligase-like ATP-grasp enzyme